MNSARGSRHEWGEREEVHQLGSLVGGAAAGMGALVAAGLEKKIFTSEM
jgi:hypothetical protein